MKTFEETKAPAFPVAMTSPKETVRLYPAANHQHVMRNKDRWKALRTFANVDRCPPKSIRYIHQQMSQAEWVVINEIAHTTVIGIVMYVPAVMKYMPA